MALRIRSTGEVVCAAEEPPMEGDLYIDDAQHHALGNHYLRREAYQEEPALCWHCKEKPDPTCIRCEPLGLYDENGQPKELALR